MAGLSDEDISNLIKLDPADFDHKEWVALAWTRDYAIFNGEFPDPQIVREFESLYTEQQRRDILAVITIMSFANRFNNTFTGQVLEVDD